MNDLEELLYELVDYCPEYFREKWDMQERAERELKLHNAAVRLAEAYDEYERNGRPSSLLGPLDEARTAYRAAKEGR